jgi:arabinofuranosyltransferase
VTVVALASTLALLLWHAKQYAFMADDAFISFRYARNLSHGLGLVYNPGLERVEGYSNFLMVILLAGFDALGLRPELMAHVISIVSTIALWSAVVWYALRSPPAPRWCWLVLLAPLWLAATRSVAVWSTGGLETRLFEALVVLGMFRLCAEVEAELRGEGRRLSWAAVLLALATLTRPDGLLVSFGALVVSALVLARRRRLQLRAVLAAAVPFLLLVGGHYGFRRLYYGQWFPNTYYAKVVQPWWQMGAIYETAFALEYAAYLWVPLLAFGVVHHWRAKTLWIPALFAAVIVPHALFIARVGGDHFEFRPLDLYFPFVFVLMYDGAKALARRAVTGALVAANAVLVLVGLFGLPSATSKQPVTGPTRAALALHALPGLRSLAGFHRQLLEWMEPRWVAVRHYEHGENQRVQAWIAEGRRLRRLVEAGLLPPDTRIAGSAAGAIPFYSQLTTIDMIGLNDARIARTPALPNTLRQIGHEHWPSNDYLRERGVDLVGLGSTNLLWNKVPRIGKLCRAGPFGPCVMADVGEGWVLIAYAPLGYEHVVRRLPRLQLHRVDDSADLDAVFARSPTAPRPQGVQPDR